MPEADLNEIIYNVNFGNEKFLKGCQGLAYNVVNVKQTQENIFLLVGTPNVQ